MINNFDYVQKNGAEIFKMCCFEVNQGLDSLIQKLSDLRETLYKCAHIQAKPLMDSTHEEDCIVISQLLKSTHNSQKKDIFVRTIEVISQYKEQFIIIDRAINKKLKNVCDLHQRNSVNRKIYDNLMTKHSQLFNYFYSLQDCDSPTKIRSDVFKF
ncbi:hypothetical protein ABPG72_008859 [Tetrahymena utriculariae]